VCWLFPGQCEAEEGTPAALSCESSTPYHGDIFKRFSCQEISKSLAFKGDK